AAEATGEAVVAETPSADAVEASSPEQAPTLAEAAVAPVTEQLMAAPEALAESPAQTAPADEAPAPVSALASLPLVDFVARLRLVSLKPPRPMRRLQMRSRWTLRPAPLRPRPRSRQPARRRRPAQHLPRLC